MADSRFKIKNGLVVDAGPSEVTGSLNAPNITGSLFGTASWALNAITASFAFTASHVLGGATQITVQDEGGAGFSAGTINFVGAGVTAANAGGGVATVTIPGAGGTTFPFTGSAIISGSLIVTGSVNSSGGFTGSLLGTASWASNATAANTASWATNVNTASWANNVLTASRALQANTASYVQNAASSSYALSASYALTASNAFTAFTASWATNVNTASRALQANTASYVQLAASSSYALSASYALTASNAFTAFTASWATNINTASWAISASYAPPTFIDNLVTVGLPGSDTDYNSIKTAIDSITDATINNTYTVKVYPGVYIEDTITLKSFVSIIGDGPESTIVSASNPSASLFLGADQSYISDMKIQGVTAPSQSAILYYTSQSVASQGILYIENVRFGSNYTHAKMFPVSGGNAAMQLTNVKYGAQPFTLGFYITSDGISTGRMLLRNVTTTAGGIQSTTGLVFAKTDQPNCTLLGNLVGLTKVGSGAAQGIGFWVENGGLLRINTANLQRFETGIYAPQTGLAPTIDAVGLNFENCTTDVLIEHTGSIGKVSGTDTFLKTQIALEAPLYEVGQDPRRITVAKKGGDFTSISASVAYITDSAENNRYVIEIGPGEFIEKQIDLRNKPYVSIIGSTIQSTQIIASGSGNFDQIFLGPTNEISFLSITGVSNPGYAAIKVDGTGDDFAQAHKISIYDFDYGIKVFSTVSSSTFYGEYIDINGAFSYGTYVSASNTSSSIASVENYYLFPSGGVSIGNYAIGSGAEIDLYTCLFVGDHVSGSTAIYLVDSAVTEVAGLDAQGWEYGVRVPNIGSAPTFRMVGAMIHNSITSDFFIEKAGTQGRFQGIADIDKINNVSEEFYWNFLDDTNGENNITRKLSVTFIDGTSTDASTLIFKGSPMGVMEGGEITISGSLTVTVAAGFGYLQDTIDTAVYKRIDWNNTNITLTANTNNYLFFNDNSILSTDGISPDSTTNIVLGRVVTNATGIEFIDQSPFNGEHMSNKLSKFNREALGPVFAEGSTVTENVTPLKLDVTQGSYFFSENNFLPAGTSSINLTQYYQSASVWARFTSSVVPNNVYTSGSALIAMSSSYYTKHTVYLIGDGVDEEYFLVINDNQYSSLILAEGATLPTTPTYFNDSVVPLAAVYVQSGSANITQIEDIRPIIGFRAAGINASAVHGNLLGLNADDHTQYLRVDGFREMSGDLGLGGNDIYNVGYVSASEFKGPLANITVINATSVTASFNGNLTGTATTASYVQNAASASYALSASHAVNAVTASRALQANTASYIQNAASASYALSASHAVNAVTASRALQANTASYIQNAASASYALSSSYALSASFAFTALTASWATNVNTSSWANNATTASRALQANTASYIQNAASASYSLSSSYALVAGSVLGSITSASYATTSSFSFNALTASWAINVNTASWANNVTSASYAQTASVVLGSVVSASYAATASVLLGTVTSASYAITASNAFTAFTSSWATNVNTASWANNVTSASYALTASVVLGSITSASYALTSSYAFTSSFAVSASWAPGGTGGGLTTKAGSITNTSFTGNPRKAIVTFSSAFANTNYAVVITGEDARSWTIEGKVTAGFTASANSNTGLTGTTYWIATAYGES